MAEPRRVSCPLGHTFKTTVRGGGTHCRACSSRVYVRGDGTTKWDDRNLRHSLDASAAGWPDPPADDAPEDAFDAREVWELSQPNPETGARGMSLAELTREFGLPGARVRHMIAAEQQRQAEVARAVNGRADRPRVSRSPGSRT